MDSVPRVKGLLLEELKLVPLFIRLMTPNGAIWSLDQRTVIKDCHIEAIIISLQGPSRGLWIIPVVPLFIDFYCPR